jgi:hypothetical protein
MDDLIPANDDRSAIYFLPPGTAVMFCDPQNDWEIDETGRNQVAFVVDERGALFHRRGRVHRIPLQELCGLQSCINRSHDVGAPRCIPLPLCRWVL